MLITRFRAILCRITLAIKRERIVSLNLAVLTRLLQVFIDGYFLQWDLLAWQTSHEERMIRCIASTWYSFGVTLLGIVGTGIGVVLLESAKTNGFAYGRGGVLMAIAVLR